MTKRTSMCLDMVLWIVLGIGVWVGPEWMIKLAISIIAMWIIFWEKYENDKQIDSCCCGDS